MKVHFQLCGQDEAAPVIWPRGWPLPNRNDTLYIVSNVDGQGRYMTIDYVQFDPDENSVTLHEKA